MSGGGQGCTGDVSGAASEGSALVPITVDLDMLASVLEGGRDNPGGRLDLTSGDT